MTTFHVCGLKQIMTGHLEMYKSSSCYVYGLLLKMDDAFLDELCFLPPRSCVVIVLTSSFVVWWEGINQQSCYRGKKRKEDRRIVMVDAMQCNAMMISQSTLYMLSSAHGDDALEAWLLVHPDISLPLHVSSRPTSSYPTEPQGYLGEDDPSSSPL